MSPEGHLVRIREFANRSHNRSCSIGSINTVARSREYELSYGGRNEGGSARTKYSQGRGYSSPTAD